MHTAVHQGHNDDHGHIVMASYDVRAVQEAKTMQLDPRCYIENINPKDIEFREKILDFTDAASFEKRENYQNFLSKDVIEKMDKERLQNSITVQQQRGKPNIWKPSKFKIRIQLNY